ncbi:nuclear factor of activated T-cells [Pimephales promelas]|nr:nuclear factor of activated T-cells [Pimephales promelas]
MPSDFISLLSADIDPSSPKSLYSKESVYDLLPKELQLPSVAQQDSRFPMSQKSGGEAGPPPAAALASDAAATCTAASSPGGLSTLPSCPSMLSATSAQEQAPRLGPAPEGVPERVCVEPGSAAGESQATPSKRRTVLSISPPPEDLLDDSRMSCQDDLPPNPDSEQSGSMWMDDSVSNFSVGSSSSYNDNTEVPRKSRKRTPRQRPGPKPAAREEAGMDVFDADSAKAPHFVLSQLGSDTKVTPKVSSLEVSNNQKGGILSIQYPQKSEGKELKILIQPETQHRARYLTEGSRGSVKDRTQQGFPTIKLEGVSEPVVLQVFVANDAGRVKPHGFYQACRVTGRNTTACKEVDIEGTTVIEVNLEPTSSMTLPVDCVGILKLRNADVEARIGVAGSKKKSTRARLAFRVNIPRPDGSVLTLQTLSSPILCTQPAGVPEILKKSLHSCSVAGGDEVFIIGKNFLKGTKVLFQENSTDESGWQAEAEIDMELFHQNHLVVKVPPYLDQTVAAPVSVGIAVVTNAGRTHDLQPFTYTPLTEKVEIPVKSELPATVKACTFEEQIKAMQTETSCLNNVLLLPMVKREEPMDVSCNATPSDIFKPVEALSSTQQILEISTVLPSATKSFPSPVALQPVDSPQSTAQIFTTQETLSTIQKQDIPSPTSFQVSLSEDTTVLQPVPPQVPQQFLRETPETLSPEDNSADGSGMVLVGIDSRNPPSQQPQVQALLPQDGVAQLERAVRELQAQQQLNSVLYSPAPSAESLQQHVQENMNSLRLGGNETSLTNQQQQQQEQNILENLHQQQQKALVDLQHQQTVLENLQQHQKVLENLQQQALGNIQQQQQQQQTHKVLENLQHQQQHQKVLENIQQQSSIVTLQHQKVIDNLQQQQQHQINLETLQHQEVLENLKQHLQSELLQTQIPMQCTPSFTSEQQSSSQTNTLSQPSEGFLQNPPQQQTALFQQTGSLMAIQTSSFLQQPSSQPSPPQPLFQSHNPLTETQDSQTVLFGSTKSPQLPSDNNQNQQQQQQITFLTPMQTSGTDAQTVSLFQGQTQLSTPMEQQAPQQQQMATPQQAPLFPNIATISPNQQQTQTGILFCTTTINPHDLPQALLFSGQNQASLGSDRLPENIFQEQQPMQVVPSSENVTANNPSNQPTVPAAQSTQNPSIIFPQASVVNVAQQDSAEPMSFQDQSTIVSDSSASMPSTRTELFHDQQPMQVVPSATSVTPVSPTDQPSVNNFLPQSAILALQGGVSSQDLPSTAAAATIFSGQSGVAVSGLQNSTPTTPQQPPSQLFQTAIGGTLSQPGQPGQAGLFLFEIPSECGQLINSPGPALSDQLVTMGHPGSDQNQSNAQIQTLLDQSNNIDEKIDELLERFQEQGKTLPRDFLDH